ncbi:MAG: hypothetical protein ACRD17_08170 [Terriglobales bacterium]
MARQDPAESGEDVGREVGGVLAAATILALGVGNRLADLEKGAGTGAIASWHLDILQNLAGELAMSIVRLQIAGPESWHVVTPLAHAARYALELRIWAEYCCRSEANARRFFEDRWLDGRDFHKAIENFAMTVGGPAASEKLAPLYDRLARTLDRTQRACGAEGDRRAFTRVSAAAEGVGLGPFFADANRVLSKFAHPTSMVVLGFTPDASKLTGFFRAVGGECCWLGLTAIGDHADALLRGAPLSP